MQKKALSVLLALILCLSLAVPALAAPDSDRGVITYTEVIAPQYEDVGRFREGLAAVKKDGKWGYGLIEYLPKLPDESDMHSWA